jgi:hypothetical protein
MTAAAFDLHLFEDLRQFDIGLLIDDQAETAGFIMFADIGYRLVKKTIIERWHGDEKVAG